jgi:hypothetical protein
MRRIEVIREMLRTLTSMRALSILPLAVTAVRKAAGMMRPKPLEEYQFERYKVIKRGLRCQEQITTNLIDYLIEFLFIMTKTANSEAQSKTKELGGQNRSQNCGLDNLELVVLQKYHEEDNLDCGGLVQYRRAQVASRGWHFDL